MARAALTAATVMAMTTPAMAHPSYDTYMDHHGAEIGYAPGDPVLKHAIWELDQRAREQWNRIDRRYDRRMRRLKRERLERQREANAVPTVPASPPSIDWYALAACESSGNWASGDGIGPDVTGGLQIATATWLGYGGGAYASKAMYATPAEQIAIAERVLAGQGPGAWPTCLGTL